MSHAAIYRDTLVVETRGRGSYNITHDVQRVVQDSGIALGLCHLFLKHTSASLMLCENADPQVRDDLERYMARLVPDGDSLFRHVDEGPDDMPAHIRTLLTHTDLTLPVTAGRCDLGVWQGLYLWEHRTLSHARRLILTVSGEG